MKLDTEQAFNRATWHACGMAPIDVGNEIARAARDPEKLPRLSNIATTCAVNLMRGAFKAHLGAEDSPTPGDNLLGYRLDQAGRELPAEWRIVLTVEASGPRVDLYNPFDESQELPDVDGDLSRGVFAAIGLAKRLAPNTNKPRPPQCVVAVSPY